MQYKTGHLLFAVGTLNDVFVELPCLGTTPKNQNTEQQQKSISCNLCFQEKVQWPGYAVLP
jgi:hypothetical protein